MSSPMPQILTVNSPLIVGRSTSSHVQLAHPSISRKHATISPDGRSLRVEDHDSRFGTFVNGIRIRATTLRAGDQIQFGTSIFYRVTSSALQLEDAPHGASLEAHGVLIVRGSHRIERIGFQWSPNQFVGILGPSGAGKSTLLNCLATYLNCQEGSIKFDGKWEIRQHSAQIRQMLGYVPQRDQNPGLLTVRENLVAAAQLRCVDLAEVERVLAQVGLEDQASKLTAILSGGQKKRLSVGIELLRRPRLLLLDEPTSGLDPANEAKLMEQLRQIAVRGTTVICTTHIMDNLRLFDRLLILGNQGGRARSAYDGTPENLQEHFQSRNLADLYERLSRGEFTPQESPPEDAPHIDSPGGNSTAAYSTQNFEPPANWKSWFAPLSRLVEDLPHSARLDQIQTVFKRGLLQIARNRGLIALLLAQPLGLGVLAALTQYRAAYVDGPLFFAAVLAIWMGLNNSARELVRERPLYLRERLAGLLPGSYLLAKGAVYLCCGLIQISLILLAFSWIGHFCWPSDILASFKQLSTIWSLTILLLAYTGGLGSGLLLSTLAKSEAAAVAALPLLIMPQMLLSAVATGDSAQPFSNARPFRPVLTIWKAPVPDDRTPRFLDVCSLATYSRPAVLAWEARTVRGASRSIWIADFMHLVLLVGITCGVTFQMFLWQEPRWLELITRDAE